MSQSANRALLDEVGQAIIEQLQQDGRRAYSTIGKAVGLSEAAVRQRVQKLVDSGVMQIVAVTDPMQVGFARQAMIAHPASGDIEAIAEALAKIDEVDYIVVTAGSVDLLAEVVVTDDEHLLRLVNGRIRAIPGVHRTETFLYLKLDQTDLQLGCPMTTTPISTRDRRSMTSTPNALSATARRAPVDALHPDVVLHRQRACRRSSAARARASTTRTASSYLDGLAGLFVVQAGHGRRRAGRGGLQAGVAARVLPALVLRSPALRSHWPTVSPTTHQAI